MADIKYETNIPTHTAPIAMGDDKEVPFTVKDLSLRQGFHVINQEYEHTIDLMWKDELISSVIIERECDD